MKKNVLIIIAIFLIALSSSFSQTANDTISAISVRDSIKSFNPTTWWTFDKRKAELNYDSLMLYNLTQKNPNPNTLHAWSYYADFSETYSDNHGWHQGSKVRYGFDKHCYFCGVGNFNEAKKYKLEGPDDKFVKKMIGRVMVVTNVWNVETYLVFHKTIKPKEILIIAASSDCWAFPVMTRYKKPILQMQLIDSSLQTGIDTSRLRIIEKIINNPNSTRSTIVNVIPVVSNKIDTIPRTPMAFESSVNLVVSTKDTIIFQDYDKEDGDRVSIYFDGSLVQGSLDIEHKVFAIPIDSDVLIIKVIAESEGLYPPCTLRVLVNNKGYLFAMKKGEKIQILRSK